MEREEFYEIVADENGWAMLIDGVQHDTYPSCHLAVEALRMRRARELRLKGKIVFRVQTAGNHMAKHVLGIGGILQT